MTEVQNLIQTVKHLRKNKIQPKAEHSLGYWHKERFAMDTHGLEQNERLCKEIAEEMVMGQSNALKVSCGVDML